MGQIPSPEDRPDPSERTTAVRARVPEHVAAGNISTGVIVVTGATEFVLDFVRNLPRPNMVVARIVLPHSVMPQFVDALTNNIQLYRQRFGELEAMPTETRPVASPTETTSQSKVVAEGLPAPPPSFGTEPGKPPLSPPPSPGVASSEGSLGPTQRPPAPPTDPDAIRPSTAPGPSGPAGSRQASPQEVYDDFKLKDELLSGAYANAVMIGHGPHEFCFDFITNFYPQSAVSARVFMAAGHIVRVLESLRTSWEQLKPRLGGPPHER